VRLLWAAALAAAAPSLLQGIEDADYTAIGHVLSFSIGLAVVIRQRRAPRDTHMSPEAYGQIPLWEGVE